nr:HNH endonuclease family protein [Saprospiraceae bacterium]
KNRIIINTKNTVRLRPSSSNHNYEDFLRIFADQIPEVKSTSKVKYQGLRQISRAFNYFLDRFNEIDENKLPLFDMNRAQNFLNKLNSAIVVKIDVKTHSDAFTLFETLNNRGVPLSAIDLIKNKLLGHLEKVDKNTNQDNNFDRWNNIINNLSDDYTLQERFLRQFYNAFKLEPEIYVDKSPKALRSNLIKIFETLIVRDPNAIFSKLEEAANVYSEFINYEKSEQSKTLKIYLSNLANVNGADGYMLLLYITTRFRLNDEDKQYLIDLLCKYFIRRNITDTPPTRDLTNYFMEMITDISQLEMYDYEAVKKILKQHGRPASDEKFEEKLKGDIYDDNVGATRYILSSLEMALSHTKEIFTDFYTRDKGKFVWTIEHIFPQGDNIPDHWVKMMADGDVSKAQDIKKNWVHKLGNLTLTGYNSQLSNISLSEKQNKMSDKKYIGFKNGLAINDDIKDIIFWTQKDIETRTNKLVDLAKDIFKI